MQLNAKYYDAVKVLVVKTAAKEYQVTERYVRICLQGAAHSEKSEHIRYYFEKKYSAVQQVLC